MKKILIIDDDKDLTYILAEFLKTYYSNQAEIKIANDGAEALIFAKNNNYDLFFLDYNMPYLTGSEVFEELVKITKNPIIMLSGNTKDLLNKINNIDNNYVVLNKPLEIDRLERYLKIL